jgi:hypothetical protein
MLGRSVLAASLAALTGWIGCAHDREVRLATPPGEPTGAITIFLTRAASDLSVAVNGTLVARRAHTRRLTVRGVPTGPAEVVIAAGAGATRIERHVQVYVEHDREITIPLGAPEPSMGSALSLSVLSVAVAVLARALALAFL